MRGFLRRSNARPDPELGELKLRAIDYALARFGGRSVADLGGVWGVDAAYSFYALERHRLDCVVICDDDFTPAVVERARGDKRVRLERGNFGAPEFAQRVGEVDAVLLFDVLLHQVRPDWDEVIELYAPLTRCFILAGPWWNGPKTERLLDLGRAAYLDAVPMPEFHAPILDRLDEINERRGRLWRDCHDIWQWGIADTDLRARLDALGYKLAYHENVGRWRGLDRFDDCSYVFARDDQFASGEERAQHA